MPSESTQTNTQLLCMQKGGPFELHRTPVPRPDADQVVIRTRVIALNGLDPVQRDHGIFVSEWPTVLGIEGAGIVETVGSNVQHVKPGDGAMLWACGLHNQDPVRGAFQEYMVADKSVVAKKPHNITLEEAASLPICFITAAMALNGSLDIPLNFLPGTLTTGKVPASILILGGSSATGAAAIQLLRIAYPKLPIFATSSPKHHDRLRTLGASEVFDYKQPSVVANILAATPQSAGVDAILDCVSAGAIQTDISTVLKTDGWKKYGEILTGVDVPVPDGVSKTRISGWDFLHLPGGNQALVALTKLIEEGKYKVPLPVQVVGHALDKLPSLLDQVKQVSGEKLVITLE